MEIRDQIAGGHTEPAARRIPLARALGEILAVYIPSFGLGILSALILLHNRNQATDQITGPVSALYEILQYVMQASVTVFGVGYFCQRRGVTLRRLFGRFQTPGPPADMAPAPAYPQPPGFGAPPAQALVTPQTSLVTPLQEPAQQPQAPTPTPGAFPGQPQAAAQPGPGGPSEQAGPPPQPYTAAPYAAAPYAAAPGPWPGYGPYLPPRPPAVRGRGWQFSRAYFVSMSGVLGFLISVIVYAAVTHQQTGAPSQGNSPYLVLAGLFVALSAGFGEEMLVTGLTVNALEAAGFVGRRAWLIYVVAVCLRIPFHLYYGWAAFGVAIFTVVNIWAYRRWRLLWPIVLAHATYDFVESLGAVTPAVAGLLLLALGLATLVMLIVVICIEASDRAARRRFERYNTAALAAQAEYAGDRGSGDGWPPAGSPGGEPWGPMAAPPAPGTEPESAA